MALQAVRESLARVVAFTDAMGARYDVPQRELVAALKALTEAVEGLADVAEASTGSSRS